MSTLSPPPPPPPPKILALPKISYQLKTAFWTSKRGLIWDLKVYQQMGLLPFRVSGGVVLQVAFDHELLYYGNAKAFIQVQIFMFSLQN